VPERLDGFDIEKAMAPTRAGVAECNGRYGGLARLELSFTLLGDGSVRFIRYSISCCGSGTTFWRLGHKSDGNTLGNDF
jgi:hypothetical protein